MYVRLVEDVNVVVIATNTHKNQNPLAHLVQVAQCVERLSEVSVGARVATEHVKRAITGIAAQSIKPS
jgi:hypothetical protein